MERRVQHKMKARVYPRGPTILSALERTVSYWQLAGQLSYGQKTDEMARHVRGLMTPPGGRQAGAF